MKYSSRKLFYAIPPAWRFAVRRLYYLPLDTWEAVTGKRDGLQPPKGMIYTGGGDFKAMGLQALRHFKEMGGLLPNHRVLDVGSGIGRMAIPLTGYLGPSGSYEGFDVVKKGVDWCTERITSKHPNFRFRYISLDNDLYRTDGGSAASFSFPYPAASFDFAIVNSVFTHMLPDEVDNYLGELHRTLRPGGAVYATFFVFGEKTKYPEGFEFPFQYGHYRLMDEVVKSANVAYEETCLRALAERHGFEVAHLFYGSWSGTPAAEAKEFQDILLLRKR